MQNEKQLCTISLGRRRKKTTHWPNSGSACVHGVAGNRCSASMLLPMKTIIPFEDEDESGMILCTYWRKILESCKQDERHHAHEYVQKVPDDTQWEIDKREFDEMIAAKKESSLGPDGIPRSIYRCAGGLGSHFLLNAYERMLEGGGVVRMRCAASRTVFIPKSTGIPSDACTLLKDASRPGK